MSDTTATPSKILWTDEEKLALLFQIIEKQGTIPWADLTLPPNRTKKAAQVMIDKEKAKLRNKAREEAEPVAAGTPGKTTSKRKANAASAANKDDDDDEAAAAMGESPTKKKKKANPRKKKATPAVVKESEDEEAGVKTEEGEADEFS